MIKYLAATGKSSHCIGQGIALYTAAKHRIL